MDVMQPIFWHQGLYLQPQHFQLSTLYQQSMIKPVLEYGLPYPWGVGRLAISESALLNHVVEISKAALMFRDGTYVEYPGNAIVSPRSFENAWLDGDQPFNVLIGLRRMRMRESNVTVVKSVAESGDAPSRFVTSTDPDDIIDLHAAGPEAKVRRLSFLLRIIWPSELEQLDAYETLLVAQLVRDGDRIVIAPDFVPPCLSVSSSDVLGRILKELRDEIAGRTRQLEQYKSPREMQKAEFDASYMVYLLALRSLNRYAPLLFHYSENPQVHPWYVYGLLRQLIGELSSFSERFNLLGEALDGTPHLPPYNHDDLGKCVTAARSLIESLLNEITIGPEFLVQLERHGDNFDADLPKGFFGQRHRFYLVTRSESDSEQMLQSFQLEAKMSAKSQIQVLVRRALPGIELIHMPIAPQGLPRRSYSRYFRIESLSTQWTGVEKEGTVSLHWSAAPEDLKVELIALRG
jgi:type VI secretion system protein ImpJ